MARKAQPTLLRELNERAVFEVVRSRGPTSRAELTRTTGISAPTISKAVSNLTEAGFLEEVGVAPQNGAGRPGKIYRLGASKVQVLGAAIDVRRCCVAAAGLDGALQPDRTLEFPTPDSYDKLIAELADRAARLMHSGAMMTLGMGISTPGEIDTLNQRVLLSPNLHMTDGQSPRDDLRERLGLETVMIHETVGTCLAEHAYGIAKGMNDFVMVGVYEGFGVSIVSGGRLIQGKEKMAGELGHITVDLNGQPCGCGNTGCLETVATDAAFARAVSKRLGNSMEVEDVIRLAQRREIDVSVELEQTLDYLAVGIAAVINIFNPEAVLVCARLLDVDENVFERLKEKVARRALKPLMSCCRILRAEGNIRQGAIAGIIHHLTRALGPIID
jgi:N-acetylglucosamine repressor